MATRAQWYALASIRGVGPARIGKLLRAYGSVDEVLAQPDAGLIGKDALSPDQLRHLRRNLLHIDQIEAMLDDWDSDGIRLVPMDSDEYPPILLTIPTAPAVLYVAGDIGYAQRPGVAIIGARSATEDEMGFARALGEAVSRAGLSVISGLAPGVDTAAHEGCLGAEGTPVGVLGHGLYASRTQESLYEEVARHGVLITEFEPSVRPTRATLMARNRVVTGLAHAVIAVALAETQGTLNALEVARRQGRPVFLSPLAASTETGHAQVEAGASVLSDPLEPTPFIQAALGFEPSQQREGEELGGQLPLFT